MADGWTVAAKSKNMVDGLPVEASNKNMVDGLAVEASNKNMAANENPERSKAPMKCGRWIIFCAHPKANERHITFINDKDIISGAPDPTKRLSYAQRQMERLVTLRTADGQLTFSCYFFARVEGGKINTNTVSDS